MIHYRDRTFCPFDKCTVMECWNRLTKEHERKANELGLPISIIVDKPECYEEGSLKKGHLRSDD